MKKKYSFIILFFTVFMFFTHESHGQSLTHTDASNAIEGLSIFPNPVVNSKVYISTKQNFTKQIDIYDVLGKKIFSTTLYGRELILSDIKAGVYILKIKEGKLSATRKLVIR